MGSGASLPITGIKLDEISPGLRSFTYRGRAVYFRLTDSRFHFIRIQHGRQHLSPDHFTESET